MPPSSPRSRSCAPPTPRRGRARPAGECECVFAGGGHHLPLTGAGWQGRGARLAERSRGIWGAGILTQGGPSGVDLLSNDGF